MLEYAWEIQEVRVNLIGQFGIRVPYYRSRCCFMIDDLNDIEIVGSDIGSIDELIVKLH